MKVYQLKSIPERFMAFKLDALTLCDQLGNDDLLPLFLGHSGGGEPLTPHWGEGVSSTFSPLSPSSTEIPDISLWGGAKLILNAKAYDLLKERLAPEGEFLPVSADGQRMYAFNCLSYGKEDEELCVRKYLDGEFVGLETLVFDDNDVAGRFLFKSKLQFGGALYCSSAFKALCNELGLEGLRFDEDLINPF
ncbi:hypothetical protein [Microbulbifer litoralis]|uniref:hypothetical protein n=1 Tax=Microbulbifer litoralis TaxID=2933965 RepID=UPI002028A26C|nr:hypothetical protein [Microbulbifer sp. GX H0434]